METSHITNNYICQYCHDTGVFESELYEGLMNCPECNTVDILNIRDIETKAQKLSTLLNENFTTGTFTVGFNSTCIFIYEHIRGFKKRRTLKEFEGIPVIYKYVGKIKPL